MLHFLLSVHCHYKINCKLDINCSLTVLKSKIYLLYTKKNHICSVEITSKQTSKIIINRNDWIFGLFSTVFYFQFNFIVRPGNKRSSQILLYSIVVSDGFQLSIYNALSEDQSANFLAFWMSEFLKLHKSIPKIFVCDMSFALINAAVRVFGQYPSISDYLDVIFSIINRKSNPITISRSHSFLIKVPSCIVRIDFAHLMNLIRCNKSLNSTGIWKKTREFYMRCVAILIQAKSLEFARNQIYSILIVANSKTEGKRSFYKLL